MEKRRRNKKKVNRDEGCWLVKKGRNEMREDERKKGEREVEVELRRVLQ